MIWQISNSYLFEIMLEKTTAQLLQTPRSYQYCDRYIRYTFLTYSNFRLADQIENMFLYRKPSKKRIYDGKFK